MTYFIFAVRIYRRRWATSLVVFLLKLLGFDIRVEFEEDKEEQERAVELFDKLGKGYLRWIEQEG